MIAAIGTVGHQVPLNQPKPSSLNRRCDGVGGGGICAGPRISKVIVHQTRKTTTINVVSCIMRSALLLDSCRPLMLYHQKYSVTTIAKKTANCSGDNRNDRCSRSLASFARRPRYWPALTLLIGPVKT